MKRMRAALFIFMFLRMTNYFAQEGSGGHYNILRIENEIKFEVPDKITDSVWQYLKTRYSNKDLYIKGIDNSFNSKSEEELFTDQYFDNKNYELLRSKNGLRHRVRNVLTDSNNRKNGQELVQLKINSINANTLNRGEYKFPVRHYKNTEDKFDNNPVIGLVKKKYRSEFVLRLKEYKINANDLLPVIKIEQLRRRIYIYKDTIPFATLTLDDVTAFYDGKTTRFTELEFELNEINYTRSNEETRTAMEKINEVMRSDILGRFPEIKQDQTPKYNKAAFKFGIQLKNGTKK